MNNAFEAIRHSKNGIIHIWAQHAKSCNELHFKDTGIGISNEDLPFIFNPYFSTRKDGSGIGLSFSKNVMEHFGGDIICISKSGAFTEFVLNFEKKTISRERSEVRE